MKILFILENYYPNIGGVETLFKSLVDNLISENIEVIVLTNKTNASLPFKESSNNLTILRFPFGSRYFFTFFAGFPAIYYAFKSDLIHTTSYNAGIPAFMASLLTRKKAVITFHEVWGKLWFDLPFFRKIGLVLHYIFEQLLLKLPFYKFVAVSDFTKKRLLDAGINPKRVHRIYNGIEYKSLIQPAEKIHNGVFTFIYFGRLGISKGLDILLGAIDILKHEKKPFKIKLIIPTTPVDLRQVIDKKIIDFDIGDVIDVKSELSKAALIQEVASADATVVPSYSEGFCFTAVESIAIGTPVISSDRGALKEVVTGKFVKLESLDQSSLVKAMRQAMDDDWDELPIKKFELSKTIDAYKGLYSEIIAS